MAFGLVSSGAVPRLGVGHSTVQRVWEEHGVKAHLNGHLQAVERFEVRREGGRCR
jgi:hypothetical protein